ncbi:diphthine--ammonia ligase [Peribacillus sp. SCS-155]|uniref:Dph6-related ATP pyrophosphatase n=1 Tax=Peribacillus sedimenti TaxID=3115297 RepID=UPI0039066262
MKNIALSWSGGKDACMALHRLKEQGYHISFLMTTLPPGMDGRSFGHGEKKDSIEKQGHALNIPVEFVYCSFDTYTDDFKQQLRKLKLKYGVDTVAFGDLYLDEHRVWGENVCNEVGLAAMYPLWMDKGESLRALEKFISSGYKAKIIKVIDAKLPQSWLGREVDEKFYLEIKDRDVCPMGESGEYHTFVYEGPLFREQLMIKLGGVRAFETSSRQEIQLISPS